MQCASTRAWKQGLHRPHKLQAPAQDNAAASDSSTLLSLPYGPSAPFVFHVDLLQASDRDGFDAAPGNMSRRTPWEHENNRDYGSATLPYGRPWTSSMLQPVWGVPTYAFTLVDIA